MISVTTDLRAVSSEEACGLIRSCLPADKKGACHLLSLHYYAFPIMYGSTAGPFGGMGGQAMTTFTIEAWHCTSTGYALFFCKGRVLSVVEEFHGSDTNFLGRNLL